MTDSASTDSASSRSPDTVEQHGTLRLTFLIVPLYAIAVAFYALQLTSALDAVHLPPAAQNLVKGLARVPGAGKFLGLGVLLFFIGLAGIAWRSLECARIMSTDPFRAFGMGRFILLFYLLVSTPLNLLSSWPKATLQAPLDAVVEANDQVALIKVADVEVSSVNLWTWLMYLAEAGCDFFTVLSLYIFARTTYELLAAGRPAYTTDHFVHDITFGRQGGKYRG
jgi:hypothetical protein